MRNQIVRYAFAVLALIIVLAPHGPATAQEPRIPKYWDDRENLEKPDLSELPRIRFLTTIDFPPFNFLDESGNLTGFNVDLARAICSELDILAKCQIQALPWSELEDAMKRNLGEAVIAGLAMTKENRKLYQFSRRYLEFPARLVVLSKAGADADTMVNDRSTKIGVIMGTAHEKMAKDFFPRARIISMTDEATLRARLKDGSVDAAFVDGMAYSFWLLSKDAENCCTFAGGPYFSRSHLGQGLAIAVRPANARLAEAFDYALGQLQRKGTFAELYLRAFPVSYY